MVLPQSDRSGVFYPADSFDSLWRYRSVMVVFLLLLFLLLLFSPNNSAGNLFPGLCGFTTFYNYSYATIRSRRGSALPARRSGVRLLTRCARGAVGADSARATEVARPPTTSRHCGEQISSRIHPRSFLVSRFDSVYRLVATSTFGSAEPSRPPCRPARVHDRRRADMRASILPAMTPKAQRKTVPFSRPIRVSPCGIRREIFYFSAPSPKRWYLFCALKLGVSPYNKPRQSEPVPCPTLAWACPLS
jgi:hypothetical protein